MKRYKCCNRKNLINSFRQKGRRLTAPRISILDLFHSYKGHFTAEEVYDLLHNRNSSISLATIYRTINSLWQSGILNRFDFGGGKAKYELSENHYNQRHHHHLICKNCGKIIEYNDFISEELELFEKLQKILSSKHNFKIEGHNLYFYGLCSKCGNSNEKS